MRHPRRKGVKMDNARKRWWRKYKKREEAKASNPNLVRCVTCPKIAHILNMVNVYEGEYQCEECAYGI